MNILYLTSFLLSIIKCNDDNELVNTDEGITKRKSKEKKVDAKTLRKISKDTSRVSKPRNSEEDFFFYLAMFILFSTFCTLLFLYRLMFS